MRLIASLLSMEIHCRVPRIVRRWLIASIVLLKALQARARLQQGAVYCEVIIRHQPQLRRLGHHAIKELPRQAVLTPAMIEPLAKRVAVLGCHIQFNMGGEQIVELADVLRRLAYADGIRSSGEPAAPGRHRASISWDCRGLLDQGRAWVRLSGAYINSKIGPPSYPEAAAIARDFVKAAPERLWDGGYNLRARPIAIFRRATAGSDQFFSFSRRVKARVGW